MSDREGEQKASGRDIILTVGQTMHQGLEPLLTKTLAPSLYQVYLHQNDYDRLRSVFPELREEARRHLEQELQKLQRQADAEVAAAAAPSTLDKLKGRFFNKGREPEAAEPAPGMHYVPAAGPGQWHVAFQLDPDESLPPGAVMVTADLAVGEEQIYSVGTKTQRISTTRYLGKMESKVETAAAARRPLAYFYYVDDGGPKTFQMTSEEIVIGRKAPDVWVDLDLETSLDVSREHARIRRRAGRFEIKDLSAYGTKVNGQEVPPSLQSVGGVDRDVDLWLDLNDGAVIDLAGIVELRFQKA
jgi:hypothetical protein